MGYYVARIEDAVFVVRADQQPAALDRMLALSAPQRAEPTVVRPVSGSARQPGGAGARHRG